MHFTNDRNLRTEIDLKNDKKWMKLMEYFKDESSKREL